MTSAVLIVKEKVVQEIENSVQSKLKPIPTSFTSICKPYGLPQEWLKDKWNPKPHTWFLTVERQNRIVTVVLKAAKNLQKPHPKNVLIFID